MRFDYLTYFVYSHRGDSENARKSRGLLGICKNGNSDFSGTLANEIVRNSESAFFENSILVPVPRSSPTVDGAVFPSAVIAESLLRNNLSN